MFRDNNKCEVIVSGIVFYNLVITAIRLFLSTAFNNCDEIKVCVGFLH